MQQYKFAVRTRIFWKKSASLADFQKAGWWTKNHWRSTPKFRSFCKSDPMLQHICAIMAPAAVYVVWLLKQVEFK